MLSFDSKIQHNIQAYLNLAPTNQLAVGIALPNGKIGYYTSAGITEDSRFDIGSITKSFTAQLILKLVSEGKLSLDDTADRYLSLRAGRYPTVKQLLTHTAGYRHITPIELVVPQFLARSYTTENLYRGVTRETVLRALSRRNACKPSNSYGYSDFPFAILSLIAESVTETPFYALMDAFLHEEYALFHTEAYPTGERTACYAGGKKLRQWTWDRENPYLAGGGIVSTLADMTAYARLQLTSEKDYVLEAQRRGATATDSRIETCLGWLSYRNSNRLWYIGGVGAFKSAIVWNPKMGCAAVVLGNSKGEKKANVHYLANLLYGEMKRNRIRID